MKKKKVFALFTAAAMLIGAAGCGNVQSETAESAASAESQPVETQKASEAVSEEGAVSEAEGETAGPGTEGIDYGGIELSFMVSKPELKEALEEITAEWGAYAGSEIRGRRSSRARYCGSGQCNRDGGRKVSST